MLLYGPQTSLPFHRHKKDFSVPTPAACRLVRTCGEEWSIPEKEVRAAVHTAVLEQQRAKAEKLYNALRNSL